ncbi:MAG: adenylyltransferase/cytidyltransferase family protein [Candidatus Nanohaloarchaea archaeon]|nr:adenylyltransferase/cytidyltransferase family protein [Candidatus Nanohaloarchaea archaeon]
MKTLFIGRFQPLHRGHLHALRQAGQSYDLVIGVGSAETSRTADNPLTFDERRRALENCLDSPDVRPIPDTNDDEDWMDWIEERFSVERCISGNDHVRRLFQERGYQVEHPDYLKPEQLSGTTIRENIAAGELWRDMVPNCCEQVLDDIDFEQRVRQSYENDG